MKYGITTVVAGSPGFIDIDEAEYNFIRTAVSNLFELLQFEELLDLVTENYYEFEIELLSVASHDMVFQDEDYFSMGHERNTIGRRIANLLSACRMFMDQSILHLNKIFGEDSKNVNLLENEKHAEYDRNFGYRVMEGLRNYTQHQGFPIQSLLFSGTWLDIDDNIKSRLHHIVIPMIKVSILKEDNNFKKSVMDEILQNSSDDYMDIRPLIRNYIEGIGKIHETVRESIQQEVEKWEGAVETTIKRYQDAFGSNDSLASLAIVAKNDNNRWIEKRTIFKDFIEKRKSLELKNRGFINLHKRFVSNEIRTKDV